MVCHLHHRLPYHSFHRCEYLWKQMCFLMRGQTRGAFYDVRASLVERVEAVSSLPPLWLHLLTLLCLEVFYDHVWNGFPWHCGRSRPGVQLSISFVIIRYRRLHPRTVLTHIYTSNSCHEHYSCLFWYDFFLRSFTSQYLRSSDATSKSSEMSVLIPQALDFPCYLTQISQGFHEFLIEVPPFRCS